MATYRFTADALVRTLPYRKGQDFSLAADAPLPQEGVPCEERWTWTLAPSTGILSFARQDTCADGTIQGESAWQAGWRFPMELAGVLIPRNYVSTEHGPQLAEPESWNLQEALDIREKFLRQGVLTPAQFELPLVRDPRPPKQP